MSPLFYNFDIVHSVSRKNPLLGFAEVSLLPKREEIALSFLKGMGLCLVAHT
jgi:hypothetical protein